MDPVHAYLRAHVEDMAEELRQFVEFESPSLDRPLLDRAASWLGGVLQGMGGEVETLPQETAGAHLVARFPGRTDEAPLVLLCHYDTVFPAGTLTRRPFTIQDGRITGPGVFDMKGGYVQALWAIRSLAAVGDGPRRPLILLSNSDEEIGSNSSRALIEDLTRGARAALVFEASQNGQVKTGRKGTAFYRLAVRGRAAHAGLEPERGISAVVELASQVLDLGRLADPDLGTTLNVGTVRGGTRSNVVAAEAEADIDVRFFRTAEADRVDRAMRSLSSHLPGARIEVTGGVNRPPLERTEAGLELYARARTIAQDLGFVLGETQVGGSSDGNFAAAVGTPVLDGLGAHGDGAHADHEYVTLEEMPLRAALAARLLAEL